MQVINIFENMWKCSFYWLLLSLSVFCEKSCTCRNFDITALWLIFQTNKYGICFVFTGSFKNSKKKFKFKKKFYQPGKKHYWQNSQSPALKRGVDYWNTSTNKKVIGILKNPPFLEHPACSDVTLYRYLYLISWTRHCYQLFYAIKCVFLPFSRFWRPHR